MSIVRGKGYEQCQGQATLAAIRGGGADTKNQGRRTNLSLEGGGHKQRQGGADAKNLGRRTNLSLEGEGHK